MPSAAAQRILSQSPQIAGMPAEEILEWASATFGSRIAFASSLGAEDQVITHMIAERGLPIPVFTLDTGRLFPESYDLIARTVERFEVPIRVMFPDAADVESMTSANGVNLFRDSIASRKRCCEVRKLRPLRRALEGLDAWVCGLRRDQSVTREELAPVEWDEANGLLKVNPLHAWSEDEVWAYIRANAVPYNPLHDDGFPSIGCAPCTRAVRPGEDVRAGRWWWEAPEHRECGLHRRPVAGAPKGASAAAEGGKASDRRGCGDGSSAEGGEG